MKGIGMKMFTGYSVAAAMLAAATLAGCPAPELHTQVLTGTNALGGKELYFIPVEDSKRLGETQYARLVTNKATLTVPVTDEHEAVTLGTVVKLDEPVVYFGVLYYNVVVSNNGTVVLTNEEDAVAGKNGNAAEHFASRQVSVLPLDVTLQAATDITLFQDADKLVVTYSGVTVGDETDNAFQVVFVTSRGLDGDLVLSYGKVNTAGTKGAAGLSDAPLEGETDQAVIDAFLARFGNGSALATPSSNTPAGS